MPWLKWTSPASPACCAANQPHPEHLCAKVTVSIYSLQNQTLIGTILYSQPKMTPIIQYKEVQYWPSQHHAAVAGTADKPHSGMTHAAIANKNVLSQAHDEMR